MGQMRGFLMATRSALFTVMSCLSIPVGTSSQGAGCHLTHRKTLFQPKYVQDGHFIIGGILTVRYEMMELYDRIVPGSISFCFLPNAQFYRHLLAFTFAIDEINSNPDILPNVTLGYHVLDSCGHVSKAIENVLQILSGPGKTVPNYSCRKYDKLLGVIGDLSSQTSLHLANIMKLYGFPQISYGATDPVLSNKHVYPHFFQTLHNDQVQFDAIVKLLNYFGWNWVGIIRSEDDSGETQSRQLEKMAAIHGICIEYSLQLPPNKYYQFIEVIHRNRRIINRATSRIVILCGTVSIRSMYLFKDESGDINQKTFIIPASWNIIIYNRNESSIPFNGSLVFTRPDKEMPGLRNFLENVRPSNRPNDILLEDIHAFYFKCLTSNPVWNNIIRHFHKIDLRNCSRKGELTKLGRQYYDTVRFGTTHHVYKAVYTMVCALHDMQLYFFKNPDKPIPTYQVQTIIKTANIQHLAIAARASL